MSEPSATGGGRISRRAVLGLIGAGAAASVAGVGLIQRARDDGSPPTSTTLAPPPDPLPDELARIEGIATVGTRYRAGHPDESQPAALAAAAGVTAAVAQSAAALAAALEARRDDIRSDFAGDDLVEVDGWLLSITEARLAGLVSTT